MGARRIFPIMGLGAKVPQRGPRMKTLLSLGTKPPEDDDRL